MEIKNNNQGIINARENSPVHIGDNIYYECTKKIDLPDKWFQEQNDYAISDLGNRYTPKLNVKLDIAQIFDGLSRNLAFKKQVYTVFDDFLTLGRQLYKEEKIVKQFPNLKKLITAIIDLFDDTDFQGVAQIPIQKFKNLIKDVREIAYEALYSQKVENSGYLTNETYNFLDALNEAEEFLDDTMIQLANKPYLLLRGKAGVGKSHLLADVVKHREKEGTFSLLFLGLHLTTKEDPWTQIFKCYKINANFESFFQALEAKAQINKSRIIIFIDGINEGEGKSIWKKHVISFTEKLKRYKWLGLVISVRSGYERYIFHDTEYMTSSFIRSTHRGFIYHKYDAIKQFFTYYNLALPKIPYFQPEFANPLFLKLFCESLQYRKLQNIPDGVQGITTIINGYISAKNDILAEKLDYSFDDNLVQEALYALVSEKLLNEEQFTSRKKARCVINDAIKECYEKKDFLDQLISEGIIMQSLFTNQNNETSNQIHITYERLDNHFTASFLLNKHRQTFTEVFKENGCLYYLIKDIHEFSYHKGLIEALSIQIPEKLNIEFYELIPVFEDKRLLLVYECFLESLQWRKLESITEKLIPYINSMFKYNGCFHSLLDTLLNVCTIPNHFFNAHFLHNHLTKYTLAQRDTLWNTYLCQHFSNESPINRLIDWAWDTKAKDYLSEESIKLAGIALTWFLSCTNRKLRDSSTKALICLLENEITVLLEILKLFETVNDPYVYERLFAVAYGCTLRTEQKDLLPKLSEYIFQTIFNTEDEIYPHILLRDYARGVIEYTNYLGYKLSIDFAKIRPPYNSIWPENIPTWDELEQKYDNDEYCTLWSSVMGYGDFARYIIGTNGYSRWSHFRLNEEKITNHDIYRQFKAKLNNKQTFLFNKVSKKIASNPTNTKPISKEEIEALVKALVEKFDKDQLLEILQLTKNPSKKIVEELQKNPRVEFEKSLSKELLQEYESTIKPIVDEKFFIKNENYFDLSIAQRMIFSKIVELGWESQLHHKFDDDFVQYTGREAKEVERIGKKYQWIAYYEFMARLSDTFAKYVDGEYKGQKFEDYEGPWGVFIRDIDPSFVTKPSTELTNRIIKKHWSDKPSYDNWVKKYDSFDLCLAELPKPETFFNLIKENTNNEEWLLLEGHPIWKESKRIGSEKWQLSRKEIWYQARSYLVPLTEYEKMKKWAVKQRFMGRWMPEKPDGTGGFNREYVWSPAAKYLHKEYHGTIENKDIFDNNTHELISKVWLTTNGFSWDLDRDFSKGEIISFMRPSQYIFHHMKLHFGNKDGEYVSKKGELIAFDPSVSYTNHSCLLIKKKPFLAFLKEYKLKIIWTLLGEKNGGTYIGEDTINRIELSGAYYLNDKGKVEGIMHKTD